MWFESSKYNCTSKFFICFQPPLSDWINAYGFLPARNSHNNQLQEGSATGSIRWDWHTAQSTGTCRRSCCSLVKLDFILMLILPSELWTLLHMILTRNIIILTRKKLMYLNYRIPFQELLAANGNKSITDYYLKMETLGFQTTRMNCVKQLITILILKVTVNRAGNFMLKIILNRFYWVWRSNRFKILPIAAFETLLVIRNKILSNEIWNWFFPNYKQSRIMLWIFRQNILPLDLLLWIFNSFVFSYIFHKLIHFINLTKTKLVLQSSPKLIENQTGIKRDFKDTNS